MELRYNIMHPMLPVDATMAAMMCHVLITCSAFVAQDDDSIIAWPPAVLTHVDTLRAV